MFLSRSIPIRKGRYQQEHAMILIMIIVVCIVSVRLIVPEQPTDPRPMWDRVFASFLGLLQCFGLVVAISVILASIEILKQAATRYQSRRVEMKLARLEPILRDSQTHATSRGFSRVLRLLRDRNEEVRQQALSAVFAIARADPTLRLSPGERELVEESLVQNFGFAQALALTALEDDLLARVTLGAKLGAGTSDKRLAPVTSSPAMLARWIELHRREQTNPEIQISIGYDTCSLPYHAERARFLGLYLFISTTDLQRFQALLRRPPRDPNAAFGLVIRGDVVEVKYPGQARGHRLDYVFPLPQRLSEANLAGLIHEIQVLNLGLLLACAADLCRVLLPGVPPNWLDNRRQAISRVYQSFERKFVALLRSHDRYRDPGQIHRLVPTDHAERIHAFESYRLEESLYPQYGWVVPLYDPDTRWERLLGPLRAVEAMLLHQGPVEGRDVTRGTDFIHQARRLGFDTTSAIEQILQGESLATSSTVLCHDPFIDSTHEEATISYLRRVSQAIARGECYHEDLPDPAMFRRAATYYEINQGPKSATVAPEEEA